MVLPNFPELAPKKREPSLDDTKRAITSNKNIFIFVFLVLCVTAASFNYFEKLWILKSSSSGSSSGIIYGRNAINNNAYINQRRTTFQNTPMRNSSGECGEDPHVPSPRTKQYEMWWEAHAKLKRSATEYVERRRNSNSNTTNSDSKPAMILIGDSITEEWLGTNMGKYHEPWKDIPQIMQDLFVPRYDPLVLAIGGDQTQHLLWRLQHGELLDGIVQDDSLFIMLIGTNNIGAGSLPEPTARGVIAVAEYILRRFDTGRLLLLQLLPRGNNQRLKKKCPPQCQDDDTTPLESFMPFIRKVNDITKGEVQKLQTIHGQKRLDLVDCGSLFVNENDLEGTGSVNMQTVHVKEDLMPDFVHPNAKGQRLLAQCILDCIDGSC